eukprot:2676346-Prymnesium_polylepis.1
MRRPCLLSVVTCAHTYRSVRGASCTAFAAFAGEMTRDVLPSHVDTHIHVASQRWGGRMTDRVSVGRHDRSNG